MPTCLELIKQYSEDSDGECVQNLLEQVEEVKVLEVEKKKATTGDKAAMLSQLVQEYAMLKKILDDLVKMFPDLDEMVHDEYTAAKIMLKEKKR